MASFFEPFSVVIIGAGISGILAAKTLHDGGYRDILILEATSRIGGRVHGVKFGGQMIEIGANWIHGGEGPLCSPVFDAAKHIKLKILLSDYSHAASHVYKQEAKTSITIGGRGGLYEKSEVESLMKDAEEIQEFGSKLSETMEEGNEEDMSIFDMQRLCNRVPATPLEKLLDYYYYDYEDGEPPQVTSLKHTLPRREFDDFGDAQYFAADPRGLESIVHYFAKQFLTYADNNVVNDPRIKFNQVVTEICYTYKGGVMVKTEDRRIYHAKTVIVSVSLGVLQNKLIKFTPKLPEWKEQAINEFKITSFTKIFLKFPYKFWPTGPGTQFFLYAHKRRGYYPIWKHYENESPGSNILLVMTSDDEAIRIEQQCNEIIKAEIMEILGKMFGNNIPNAEGILVSRWKSNKFYQGCFSNWPVGYTQQSHQQLRAPVCSIYFTGEHTSPDHFGCIEGAFFAGCNTGREVIKYLQKNRTP